MDQSKTHMILLRNLTLHSNIVNNYLRTFRIPSTYPGDRADLHQVGLLGILKAIKTFDEDKSSFKTWAWFWIRSYIRDEITKHKPSGYTEYEDNPSLDRYVLIAQFFNFIDGEKDKEILSRFLSGQTTTDIGKDWGVSRQSIDQRLYKIHRKIKESL